MAPPSKKRQSEGHKGQRSISSFFAAKQPPSAASAGQPGPDQPRPKRQRTSDGDQLQQHNQAPPVQATPVVAPISGTAIATPPPQRRASKAEQEQEPDPAESLARQNARHQRFQNKLVIGRGNSKRDAAAPVDVGAAKPKYTPLELQIVTLKHKHPNVLLIVEVGCVRLHTALWSTSTICMSCFMLQRSQKLSGVWHGDQQLCDSCHAGISFASLARMQRLQRVSAISLHTQVGQAGCFNWSAAVQRHLHGVCS